MRLLPIREGALVLLGVFGLLTLGAAMWVWAIRHIAHDVGMEQHGIRVSATVLAHGDNPKYPSEQLSFPLPDGTRATEWSSAVDSQQASGSSVAVVYLPGQPATVESTSYLRWWWVALIMPVFGTGFLIAGLLLLWAFVGAVVR